MAVNAAGDDFLLPAPWQRAARDRLFGQNTELPSERPAMSTIAAHLSKPATRRAPAIAGAIALAAAAIVHLLDGPGSLEENSAIGLLELALAAAAVPLALGLVVSPVRDVWMAAGALCLVALGFYVASRTVGLFGSTDDIGNWLTTLGVLNVASQVTVIGLAANAVFRRQG